MGEVENMLRRLIGKIFNRPLWLVKRDRGYSVFFTVGDNEIDDVYDALKERDVYFVKVRISGSYMTRHNKIRQYSYYKVYLYDKGFISPFEGTLKVINGLLGKLENAGLLERKFSDIELIMLMGDI